MTDADLVRLACNGQTSAYEVLVRRWSARVVGYIRSKVRCPEVAEDLAQDSLLKGFRSLHTLADPSKFGPWMLSIAHRSAVDWLKAKARGEVKFSDADVGETGGLSDGWRANEEQPEARLARREQKTRLRAEIGNLPEPLREVLMMYYYDDVTYKELADMLGVSAATVNARLTKARDALRNRFLGGRDEL